MPLHQDKLCLILILVPCIFAELYQHANGQHQKSGSVHLITPSGFSYVLNSTGYHKPQDTTSSGSGCVGYKCSKPTSFSAPSSSGSTGSGPSSTGYQAQMYKPSYQQPSSSGTGYTYPKPYAHYKKKPMMYTSPTTSGSGTASDTGVAYEKKKQKKHQASYKTPSSSGSGYTKVPTYSPPSSAASGYTKPKLSYKVPLSTGTGVYIPKFTYHKPIHHSLKAAYQVPVSTDLAHYPYKLNGMTHAVFKPLPLYCPLCSPKTVSLHQKLLHLHHYKQAALHQVKFHVGIAPHL